MTNPPCNQCDAACCRAGNHGWSGSANNVPYNAAGRCPYLMRDNRCSIYDARPQACTDFDCRERPEFLARMPDVAALVAQGANEWA